MSYNIGTINKLELESEICGTTFSEAKKVLLNELAAHNYEERLEELLAKRSQPNTASLILAQCAKSNSQIQISFPGYKSKRNKFGKIIYDYRVDLVTDDYRTSLSHVNLLIDLYIKCEHGKLEPVKAMEFLVNLFANGNAYDCDFEALNFEDFEIGDKIIKEVTSFHSDMGKIYNRLGSNKLLTDEEFSKSLKLIALQEDINYPIRGRIQGRKMCLKRYIETLYLFSDRVQGRTLKDVLQRTLEHRIPDDWPELAEINRRIDLHVR
jgi:hypothetical protein